MRVPVKPHTAWHVALLLAAAASANLAIAGEARVQHHPAGWQIDASGADRAALAAELARQSGSRVSGDLRALAGTRPVRLRLAGATLDAAWQALLDGSVNHARRCDAARCELWLAGVVPQAASPAARAPASTTSTIAASVSALAVPPAPAHAPTPPAADPPGLFPAD